MTAQAVGVDVGRLRPHYGRVLVSPSPVDEAVLGSGLVVPVQFEGDDGLERGVIIHIDDPSISYPHSLAPGFVVYYRGGVRLAGHVLLEQNQIYAYEDPEP